MRCGCGAFVAALVGQHLHPDRDEPRQRLLGREARGRLGRSARPGAGHRVGAGRPAPRSRRDLGGVRGRRRGRRVPDRCRRPGDPGGRRRLDPRRRPVHGRPATVRLRGARRGVRVPVLRPRRGQRLLLRPGRAARLAAVRPVAPGRFPVDRDPRRQQRPRHRHRPARREADAGGAARPPPGARAVLGPDRRGVLRAPGGAWGGGRAGVGDCSRSARRPARASTAAGGRDAHRRRRAQRARSPGRAPCSRRSASCSPRGCCSQRPDADRARRAGPLRAPLPGALRHGARDAAAAGDDPALRLRHRRGDRRARRGGPAVAAGRATTSRGSSAGSRVRPGGWPARTSATFAARRRCRRRSGPSFTRRRDGGCRRRPPPRSRWRSSTSPARQLADAAVAAARRRCGAPGALQRHPRRGRARPGGGERCAPGRRAASRPSSSSSASGTTCGRSRPCGRRSARPP